MGNTGASWRAWARHDETHQSRRWRIRLGNTGCDGGGLRQGSSQIFLRGDSLLGGRDMTLPSMCKPGSRDF